MTDQDVLQALKRYLKNETEHNIIGKVVSVDSLKEVCEVQPLNMTANVVECRIVADVKGKTKYIPTVGSVVLVSMFSNTAGVITGFSELDEINLKGNDKGGLVIVDILLQKLNNIENLLNTFITTFNTHTHLDTVTSAPIAPTLTLVTQVLTPTVITEIENLKVTHGTLG